MGVDFAGSHKAMDVKGHKSTYEGFIKLTIYSTVAIVVVLIGMALFLV